MDNFFTGNPDIQWHFEHLDIEEVAASLEELGDAFAEDLRERR